MTTLTVVTFKWTPPRHYRSTFGPETVRVLRNMVARHYPQPHRFVCITDDARGLKDVETIPLWPDFKDVLSPHGAHQPSCYRRLRLFSSDAASLVGQRFVCLDLDTVIVGDLTPLWDRPEDFVIWGETNPKSFYNGSMLLMTAGARRKVWDTFNPNVSPAQAKAAGKFGSDQGWISYCLGNGEATWTTADGVYSYGVHVKASKALPTNARIVMFHGAVDPWSPDGQCLAWVREHWQ